MFNPISVTILIPILATYIGSILDQYWKQILVPDIGSILVPSIDPILVTNTYPNIGPQHWINIGPSMTNFWEKRRKYDSNQHWSDLFGHLWHWMQESNRIPSLFNIFHQNQVSILYQCCSNTGSLLADDIGQL